MKTIWLLVVLLCFPLTCFAIEMERVGLEIAPGKTVQVGMAYPEGKGPFPVVIMQRGNGGALGQYESAVSRFAEAGYLAVAIDYTVSNENFSTAVLQIADVVSALAKMPLANTQKLFVWGFSMGGAAVLSYASSNPVHAIVVYAGAYSRLSAPVVEDIKAPIFMMHSSDDKRIPLAIADEFERLAKKLGKSVSYKGYSGKGHMWDSEVIRDSLVFIQQQK